MTNPSHQRACRSAICPACRKRLGLAHAFALPLWGDGRLLVSVVSNRRGLHFSARDRARLEWLRPHLASLQRQARAQLGASARARAAQHAPAEEGMACTGLTPRENEVLAWLSHGKTDAQIATLLGLSPRTVQKHLEHIYVKLGVETRTAAVMRAQALRPAH